MSEHKYEFSVTMSCSGCSGAVERVLKKLEGMSLSLSSTPISLSPFLGNIPGVGADMEWLCAGVKSYEVSLDSQTAVVVADESLPYEKVLRTIAKTGKKVTAGKADGVEQSVEVPAE